ncbi:MAG: HPF/RaiA family ribosome-associated protein [Lapillicoccus sp.]
MNVVLHTDNTINGHETLTSRVVSEVETVLARYDDRVKQVEVHLADGSAGRSTENDIRCVMEATLEGQSPAIATEHADTVDEAVRGAAHRLERVVESQLGRLSNDTARRHA